MKTSGARTTVLLLAAFVFAPAARAAVDAFIWFEDGSIRGESKDPQHLNWIEVSSFHLDRIRNGAPIGGAAGGGGTGKVSVHDISITKHVDASSSAKLFHACATGKHFPTVKLSMRKAGGDPGYLEVVLHDVFLTGYQKSSGGDRPTESLSLNFTKIEYKNMGTPPAGKPDPAYALPGAVKMPTATPASAQAPAVRR